MAQAARILGVVLAGGRASRYGSDKALAVLAGQSLLDRAVAALAPYCAQVAVAGRAHPPLPAVVDRPAPGMGPLGGLNGALHHARDHGYAGVLMTGCDMPAFPPELAHALIGESAAVLARQHLASYWPAALADALDAHLATCEDRSLYGWIEAVQPRFITLPGLILPNINRPDDLAALEIKPEA